MEANGRPDDTPVAVHSRMKLGLSFVGSSLDDADCKSQEGVESNSAELRGVLHLHGEVHFKGFCECYEYQWVLRTS
jgi:hypothetical protein